MFVRFYELMKVVMQSEKYVDLAKVIVLNIWYCDDKLLIDDR